MAFGLSLANHQATLFVAADCIGCGLYLLDRPFKSDCLNRAIFLSERFCALASLTRWAFFDILKFAVDFGELDVDHLLLIVDGLQLLHLSGREHRSLLEPFL